MLSAGLPSNFTNNHMGMFSSAGIRNYGSLDGSGQLSSSSNLHGVLGASGIPGLAATSGTGLENDIRSFDQRRREFFAAGMHDHHVKREEVRAKDKLHLLAVFGCQKSLQIFIEFIECPSML
jgi:hypothetical protein